MPRVDTEDCPTCHGEFTERRTELVRVSQIPHGPHEEDWTLTVACAQGHRFRLLGECNISPRFSVSVPEVVRGSSLVPRQSPTPDCGGCRLPIQPGQAFLTQDGRAFHLGC